MSLLLASLLFIAGAEQPAQPFPCFKHHGRFSTQNGLTRRLWLIGTNRSLAVDGELPKPLADLEDPYMSLTGDYHSYIYGDFTICPLEPDLPGHARLVKLTSAERLVVEPPADIHPTFRVLGTWPAQPSRLPPRSQPPAVVRSTGGFTAHRLTGQPVIDDNEWIELNSTSGNAGRRIDASDGSFVLRFVDPTVADTGDVERFQLTFTSHNTASVRVDRDLTSWAFLTPDDRFVLIEPLFAIDIRAWKKYPLHDLLEISNYTIVEAVSRDKQRLLISRGDCAIDCRGQIREYYELVLPK